MNHPHSMERRAKELAALILDADIPNRLLQENEKLRSVLLEVQHGAEYPDELGDKIAAALPITPLPAQADPRIDSIGYYALQLGAADATIKRLQEQLLTIHKLMPPVPADGVDLKDKTKVQIFNAVRAAIYGGPR